MSVLFKAQDDAPVPDSTRWVRISLFARISQCSFAARLFSVTGPSNQVFCPN